MFWGASRLLIHAARPAVNSVSAVPAVPEVLNPGPTWPGNRDRLFGEISFPQGRLLMTKKEKFHKRRSMSLRSPAGGHRILDFLVFLSPGDLPVHFVHAPTMFMTTAVLRRGEREAVSCRNSVPSCLGLRVSSAPFRGRVLLSGASLEACSGRHPAC